MTIAIVIFAVLALLVLAAVALKNSTPAEPAEVLPTKAGPPPTQRQLLTPREREMFALLVKALPGTPVLAQVAGGALLQSSTQAVRNKFQQLQVDFVLLTDDLNVLAVIELDDRSHDKKKDKDADRDEMFRQAGYSVLRLANVPRSVEALQEVVAKLKPGTVVNE